jgi:hypothetical protein
MVHFAQDVDLSLSDSNSVPQQLMGFRIALRFVGPLTVKPIFVAAK